MPALSKYRVSPGSLYPLTHMTDEEANGNEKQMSCDSSTDTKTRTNKDKLSSQSSSSKCLDDTMEIVHCAFEPLRKESDVPHGSFSVHNHISAAPIISNTTASELSKKQTENISEELIEASNNQTKTSLSGKSASPKMDEKLGLSTEDCENQTCLTKHSIPAQIQDVCSAKAQTAPSLILKKQVSCDKTQLTSPSSDKKKIFLLNQVSTKLPAEQSLSFTQSTVPTEVKDKYKIGPLSFAKPTPVTTVNVQSGLRLLSIVSTESLPNLHKTTKPRGNNTIESSTAITATSETKDGLPVSSISSDHMSKTTTAKSTITSQESSTLPTSGHPKSPSITFKGPKAVHFTSPPSTTTPPNTPTIRYLIDIPNSPSTTPEKLIGLSNAAGCRQQITTPSTRSGMIASTPNSPISTTSPAPLKENESPRTPQGEPRSFKTWLPPPDIDPMSQTFLRMPFTYQSLQVQCNNGNRPHVKRPMNAFMVWAKKHRASIANRFPNASNAEISVRLGHIWNELPNSEQKPYFDEANELKVKHKHENPNWVYQPRPGKKCRKALFTSCASKSQPSSPVARRINTKGYNRPIHPRSAPSSPAVKRPLWPQRTELSEEELQSRLVEDLLEDEIHEKIEESTGNPTMDRYIDEWLSPKRTRKEVNELCLMKDAMLPAVNDDEQNILEEETRCDGKDFEKYIKQLRTERNNFTKLENNISNLEDDEVECA